MGNGLLDVTANPGLPRRWRWTWWPRPATSSSPMSPYAGKYVGYTRRRACPPLRYRRGDGQLNASNQIILNQLTFGDRVESPDATTLPVRFAVALLKDSRRRHRRRPAGQRLHQRPGVQRRWHRLAADPEPDR
jgi:hypothetical protein